VRLHARFVCDYILMVQGASTPKKIALEMACLNIGVLPTVAIYEMITRCAFRLMMQIKSGDSRFVDKEKQRQVAMRLTPEIDKEDYFVNVLNDSGDHDKLSITTASSDSPLPNTNFAYDLAVNFN
jgi:hypothetical protein